MSEEKKKEEKIADITQDEELSETEMSDVSGGLFIKRTFISAKDNCNGNCMGSVPTATGKDVDI